MKQLFSISILFCLLFLSIGSVGSNLGSNSLNSSNPAAEDLNVYQYAIDEPKPFNWYVNETVNFSLTIINSLNDEPFYNLTFNHKFMEDFIIVNSTAKAENSSIFYNGTNSHNVSYVWDSILPNETLTFWITLKVMRTGETTISAFVINYQTEDGAPKTTVSSNSWNIRVDEPDYQPETGIEDEGPGPKEGTIDITPALIIIGFSLPMIAFGLSYFSFYFLRIRKRR